MNDPAKNNCPHCGNALNLELVSQLQDSSRVFLTIAPHEGELLNAETVGGVIIQLDKLLRAVGRDVGVKTNVNVESLTCENGTVTIGVLASRFLPEIGKRKAPTP